MEPEDSRDGSIPTERNLSSHPIITSLAAAECTTSTVTPGQSAAPNPSSFASHPQMAPAGSGTGGLTSHEVPAATRPKPSNTPTEQKIVEDKTELVGIGKSSVSKPRSKGEFAEDSQRSEASSWSKGEYDHRDITDEPQRVKVPPPDFRSPGSALQIALAYAASKRSSNTRG